jgi:hypothetical protein
MKRIHRAWHLSIWFALAPLVILIVFLALWARGGAP